jgi:hypothetical protein
MVPARQTLYYKGVKLEFDHKTLRHYDIKAGSTIHLQDQGSQIPLRMAKWMVMAGPPVIFSLFSAYHEEIFAQIEGITAEGDERYMDLVLYEEGTAQLLAKYMVCFHFGKVLLESFALHRMAGRMVSLNRTLWQILFYWLGFGGLVGYSLFTPNYEPSFLFTGRNTEEEEESRVLFAAVATSLFLFAEMMNAMCHIHFG